MCINSFKPKVSLVTPNTPGFAGGGLNGTSAAGVGIVSPDPARTAVINDLSNVADTTANTYGDLYNTVRPGFNDLLSARLNDLNGTARSAIGDLSQNLSARRVLGSSFGQDTITRANAQFAKQRDQIIADNFLKSLEAQRQLTADQFNTRIRAFQPKLDELNLEAGLAANLAKAGSEAMNNAAQFNAKNQNASNAAGLNSLGSLLGTALGFGRSMFTGGSFGGGGGNFLTGSGSSLGNGFSFDGGSVDPGLVSFV